MGEIPLNYAMKCLDIEELYGKSNKLKREHVQRVHEWLSKQPHLPKITDLEIACFLRASNYSIESAKYRIDNYYTCRTHIAEYNKRDILDDDVLYIKDVV